MELYDLIYYLAAACAVILVFAPHEFAHAFVAYKQGDATPKLRGRLTLNPFKHIDFTGYLFFVLVGFGWAKPVPIEPANFRHYKRGLFLTSVAGVFVNYIIAFLAYLLFVLCERYMFVPYDNQIVFWLCWFVEQFFYILFAYSLCSVVFNLLPFFPLDGFRVIEALTRQVNPVQKFLRNYGQMILTILIAESFLCDVLVRFGVGWAAWCDILGYVMTFATEIIGAPIKFAWNWILTI